MTLISPACTSYLKDRHGKLVGNNRQMFTPDIFFYPAFLAHLKVWLRSDDSSSGSRKQCGSYQFFIFVIKDGTELVGATTAVTLVCATLSGVFNTLSSWLKRSMYPSLQVDGKFLSFSETISPEVRAAFNPADGRTLFLWGALCSQVPCAVSCNGATKVERQCLG